MKFYVLTQKQETGCPLGMLNGVLVDGFDPEAHKKDYGLQPWYANPVRGLPHEPFPDTLCFVTKDPKYSFAIRSRIPFFYIASDALIDACRRLRVDIEDASRIDIRSRQNKAVSNLDYWVCTFKPTELERVADQGSVLEKSGAVHTRIRRLRVRQDFADDLFRMAGVPADIDTLICSERFRDLATREGFKGIEYTDVDVFDWPPARSPEEQMMRALAGEPLVHPI
jgi:hypothetical protein